MTREEFWQRVFLKIMSEGFSAHDSALAADGALKEYDARFPSPTFQYHVPISPPAGTPHPLGHE